MSIKDFRKRPWHQYKKGDASFKLLTDIDGFHTVEFTAETHPPELGIRISPDDTEGYNKLMKDMEAYADENGFEPF